MADGKREYRTYLIEHRNAQDELVKSYVGVTIRSLEARLSAHLREASRAKRSISPYSLGHAIRQELLADMENASRFSIRQLSIHESQTEMLADETVWIEKLGTMAPNGYNLMPGGRSAGGIGNSQAMELFVDGVLRTFPSIKQAAHALAEAASLDPKKFAARVYSRRGKGWPLAEAFDLEPHEDGRTTERSRQAAAAGVLLATARSKDHRDWLKARQASIKKGSLLPHPREPGLFVTIDQFIDISGLPKSTVTRRLRRIWPIENLPSEDVILALTKREDRRRIFEFTLDGETVRAGVNELAARFERPRGNSRSAIKKRLGALPEPAGEVEILQAVGVLQRTSKRVLVSAQAVPVRNLLIGNWSVRYQSQFKELPRQMDFVRWLSSFMFPLLDGQDRRKEELRLQKSVSALAKKGRQPWEIAALVAGVDRVDAPSKRNSSHR